MSEPNPHPMKSASIIMLACLLTSAFLNAQTGSSCGTPYNIILDGVTRTFATSSSTGGAVVCTNGTYPNTSPITWFSFTTNASAEMPLLDITAGDSSSCEIAMYTACNGSNTLQTTSSMCFDDGWGLWAPAHNYTLSANTTYRLRIKTQSATQLKITAQNHTPTNNLCSGATPVDVNFIDDNNACNHPSTEVTPSQLCAYTIENTAFYQFYVASTGSAIINITDIHCDNGAFGDDNGFQIGFFTGSCGALVPLSCNAGSGTFVQATTPSLAGGTKVYVAIDGYSGSNCQYRLQAINAYSVLLDEEFKNFSAWKTPSSNVLKWESNHDQNAYYEVERSVNGSDFVSVDKIITQSTGASYKYEDKNPFQHAFYRVKRVTSTGKISMSNTLTVNRDQKSEFNFKLVNPVIKNLDLEIESEIPAKLDYAVMSIYGQIFLRGSMQINSGVNKFNKAVSTLPQGQYVISLSNNGKQFNYSFIKTN